MQVSNLDTVPTSGSEKNATKPATAASNAFAILLQNTYEPPINPGLLHLADASSLVRRLSSDRETFSEARPVDDDVAEERVDFDAEDSAPAPDKVVEKARDDEAADTAGPADNTVPLADATA